jgi:hypothetical protein
VEQIEASMPLEHTVGTADLGQYSEAESSCQANQQFARAKHMTDNYDQPVISDS